MQQFLSYDNNKRLRNKNINCAVPQVSILGPRLFLLYVNYLYNASIIFKPIMFADDTNLFLSAKNIKPVFQIINKELSIIQIGSMQINCF